MDEDEDRYQRVITVAWTFALTMFATAVIGGLAWALWSLK